MNLTVNPGECYLLDHGGSVKHFFFVISAPDCHPGRQLVLVPISSTSQEKNVDPSCMLCVGDHSCCSVESFAFYRGAILLSLANLERMMNQQKAMHRPPQANARLLKRLRDGAEMSEELPDKIRDELYVQGILPPIRLS